MVSSEVIFVFGAHSDDFVIGAGGTIAKYAAEGKKVISIVFSYGENSHPWIKEKVVQKFRKQEADEASKILGCETHFFDLKELKIYDEYKEKCYEKVLLDMLNEEKPTKIFTHSNEDPHPDHKSVNKIAFELYNQLDYKPKPEFYVYSVWNPVSLKTRYPALYVDITKTFVKKLEALKAFKSQKIHVAYPFVMLLIRNIKAGISIGKFFGEKYFRIK